MMEDRIKHILNSIRKDYLWLVENGKLMCMDEREVDGAVYEIRISNTEVLEIYTKDFEVTKHKVVNNKK